MQLVVISLVCLALVSTSLARGTTRHQDPSYDENEDDDEEYPTTEDTDSPDDEFVPSADLPDFVTRGGKISVQKGGKITLPCQVNDLGSRTMIWLKRPGLKSAEDQLYIGVKVASNPHLDVRELPEGGGTVLTLTEATPEDAGTYTCRIADEKVHRSLEFVLEVSQQQQQQPRHPQPQMSATDGSSRPLLTPGGVLLSLAVATWTIL